MHGMKLDILLLIKRHKNEKGLSQNNENTLNFPNFQLVHSKIPPNSVTLIKKLRKIILKYKSYCKNKYKANQTPLFIYFLLHDVF